MRESIAALTGFDMRSRVYLRAVDWCIDASTILMYEEYMV